MRTGTPAEPHARPATTRTAPEKPLQDARSRVAPATDGRPRPIALDPAMCAELVASERWASTVAAGDDGCLIWTGTGNGEGYGRIWLDGRMVYSHRVAFVAATGADIDPGLTVDHLCRRRACVNPEHLEPVSNRENLLRGETIVAERARRTRCPRGHELAGDNLRPSELARGWRVCLTCSREHSRLVAAAARALGLTQTAYAAEHGRSRATAEAILADAGPVQLDLFGIAS